MVGVFHRMRVGVRRQVVEVRSLRLNSDYEACQQAPLTEEPYCQPMTFILNSAFFPELYTFMFIK